MIAAVLEQPRRFSFRKVSTSFNQDELSIRVLGCGICTSSIPLWEGRDWFRYPQPPGSPGHEAWGIVERTGEEVSLFKPGDAVAFISGHSFAEFDTIHEKNAVLLPEQLTGIPFPGEPLGCAVNIFRRSDISFGDTVVILGIGFLGALLCQLAYSAGAKIIAVSRRKYALIMAENLGATALEWKDIHTTSEEILEVSGGKCCPRVIEATGKQEGIDLATEIIAERGRLVIAGYHQDGPRHIDLQKWNWKGIDVINAHERDPDIYIDGMRHALEEISSGRLTPEPLYTHRLKFNELNRGFEMARERPAGFMKALIEIK